MNAPESMVVDHINGDKRDNRRANLRVVTFAENVQNRTRLPANNTSGIRGIVWDRNRSKWIAQVKNGWQNVSLRALRHERRSQSYSSRLASKEYARSDRLVHNFLVIVSGVGTVGVIYLRNFDLRVFQLTLSEPH